MQHPDDLMLSQLMDGEWHELDAPDCVRRLCADDAGKSRWARYHLIRDVMRNDSPESLRMADGELVARIRLAIADEPAYSNITPFGGSRVSEGAAAGASIGVESSVRHMNRPGDEVSGLETAASASAGRSATANGGRGWMPDLRSGMTGFALAASVAGATVIGLNLWNAPSVGAPLLSGDATVATAEPDSDAESEGVRVAATPDAVGVFAQQVPGAPLPEVEYVANTGAYWVTPSSGRSHSEERLNMFLSQHIENSPTSDREGMLPYSRLVGYAERPAER